MEYMCVSMDRARMKMILPPVVEEYRERRQRGFAEYAWDWSGAVEVYPMGGAKTVSQDGDLQGQANAQPGVQSPWKDLVTFLLLHRAHNRMLEDLAEFDEPFPFNWVRE
jgi:hypothetical protein